MTPIRKNEQLFSLSKCMILFPFFFPNIYFINYLYSLLYMDNIEFK